jgi:hypothetical protein
MTGKIISIEQDPGAFHTVLERTMRMVPERDRGDTCLQRLIAFRLKSDGESATREYLMLRIREMIQCAYAGRMFDFLKNDEKLKECGFMSHTDDPPEIA